MANAITIGVCIVLLAADIALTVRRDRRPRTSLRGLPIVPVEEPYEVHNATYPLETRLGIDVEVSTQEVETGGHRYQITRWGRGREKLLDEAWDCDEGVMVILDSRGL